MRRIRQSLSVASLDPIPALSTGFSDKVTTTPLVVQDGFGYGGVRLPADGLSYCGPTAATMPLLWLGKNGWTQIGPAAPKKEDVLRLDRLPFGRKIDEIEDLIGRATQSARTKVRTEDRANSSAAAI